MIHIKQHKVIVALLLALLTTSCTDYKEAEAPAEISVNVTELSFPFDSANRVVTVKSGSIWAVSSKPEWVSVKSIDSSASAFQWDVTLSASENDEYDREGDIIFLSNEFGSAGITVSQQGRKGKYVAVSTVYISPETLSLTVGETAKLTASIAPWSASVKTMTWKSLSPAIATVDDEGGVTAVSEGRTTIQVTTDDGNKTATCAITVKAAVPVTGVSLNRTSLSLEEGDTFSLVATVTPSNATDKSVSWVSSNTDVAKVSSDGVVTALSPGTAVVTVKTNDGAKIATCVVTVSKKAIAVTGVSLSKSSLALTEGDTQTLVATVAPSNATNKDVTWSSSDTGVATVSSSGVVTAKKAGTATITVTTVDGGKTATCAVTVKAPEVPVTGVSLNHTALTLLEGQTETLSATVSPTNASNKSVTWSSNNTAVATISSAGVVTAIKAGMATITVTTVDGGKTATCAVTVKTKDIGGPGNEGTEEEDLF